MTTYTIAIIGSGGVGKSSFLDLFDRRDFKFNHVIESIINDNNDNNKVEFSSVEMKTNHGEVIINFIILLKESQKEKNFDALLKRCDGCIIMVDPTSLFSFGNLDILFDKVVNKIPTIVLVNKMDINYEEFIADKVKQLDSIKELCRNNSFIFLKYSTKEPVKQFEPIEILLAKFMDKPIKSVKIEYNYNNNKKFTEEELDLFE